MSKVLPVEMLPAHSPTGVAPVPGVLPPAPPPTPGMVGGGLGTIQDFNQNNPRTVLGQLGFLADVGRSVLQMLGGTPPTYETWDTTKGPPVASGTPRYQTLMRFGSMAPPFSGNLFHGTGHVFQEFEDVAQSAQSLYGPGHYFTDSPEVASQYAETKLPARRPMTEAERAAYFIPGTVVKSPVIAGDYERVLKYTPGTAERNWSVTIEPVMKDPVSGEWVPDTSASLFWGRDRPIVHSDNPMIRPAAQPNVHVAHIELKNPFDVEEKPDPAIVEKLIAQSDPRNDPNFERLPKGSERLKEHQEIADRLRKARTNEDVYRWMAILHKDDLAKVNQDLEQLGFDGIQHVGGRILGGPPHNVKVVFQRRASIQPPRWPAIRPSPPPE